MLSCRAALAAASAGLALLVAAPAAAIPEGPPAFLPDRTAEDYSHLRDPARRGHWQDGYKFIPLTADGSVHLSLGGEFRERFELFDAPRFGIGAAESDAYLLQRLLLHGDLRFGRAVRVFAQLGAHEAFGKMLVNPPDEDRLDIQQLFVDVAPVEGLRLRLGRQEMILNATQRFVSFRDGTNVRQNFEGGRVTWERGATRIEGVAVRPVTLRPGIFDNVGNDDQTLLGIYASRRIGAARTASIDAYWLLLDRDKLVIGPHTGGERRHSLGLRYTGAVSGWDWDLEGVHQFGASVGRDISAWAVSADIGRSFPASPLKPRLGLRFDAGSGDADPADSREGAFHPLFPSGPYFNEANLTSWTNLLAVRPSVRLQPEPRFAFTGAVQFKWRQTQGDAVYLGPSAPLVPTRSVPGHHIGQVYTLDVTFQLNRHLALRGYYLRHTAGAAIGAAGGRPIDFGMASTTLRF